MPGPRGEGFLGGLLEGVAGALYEKHQQKQQQEIEGNRTLASVLLKGLDQDPTRETASAVLPKVAELLHIPLQSIFGGAKGKGKGGKGSSLLGDPEALSGVFEGLAGAFPSRADVMKRQAEATAQENKQKLDLFRSEQEIIGERETKVAEAKAKPEKGPITTGDRISNIDFDRMGNPVDHSKGARYQVYKVGDRFEVESVESKAPPRAAALTPVEKLGEAEAARSGKKFQELTPQEQQAFSTLGVKRKDQETAKKQQESSARLGAYLRSAKDAASMSEERLSELKDLFPHVLAAKEAGEQVAALRPEVIRQQLAKGEKALGKADLASVKEAEKVVQQATKLAQSKVMKESATGRALGWNDSEETIRKNLIRELSAGQDPAAVEALAKQATEAPTATPKPASPSAVPPNPFR